MVEEFELVESLGVTVLSRVSAHGKGLYLYIPKDIVEAYRILAGHKLEVQIRRHFRPKTGECNASMKVLHTSKSGGEKEE